MDRLEQNHEGLARQVTGLEGTVARVELNQLHAEKLNEMRFAALGTAVQTVEGRVSAVDTKLDAFMARIESIISGETQLPQARQGEKLVADYLAWREKTDGRLDAQDVRNGQIGLLAKLGVLLVTSNVIAIIVAIFK